MLSIGGICFLAGGYSQDCEIPRLKDETTLFVKFRINGILDMEWAEIGIGGNTDTDLRYATKSLFLYTFRIAARSVSWQSWTGFRIIVVNLMFCLSRTMTVGGSLLYFVGNRDFQICNMPLLAFDFGNTMGGHGISMILKLQYIRSSGSVAFVKYNSS